MNCPYAPTTGSLADAPLAGPLPAAFPEAINRRYRSIEDPDTVRGILRRPGEFTTANALRTAINLAPAALRILAAVKFALPPALSSASGSEHLAVRRLVAGFFSPAKIQWQRRPITERVREICARLEPRYRNGEVLDLAAELAAVIPVEIMAVLTGVRVPPAENLKRWSQDSLELFWGWPAEDRQLVLAASAAEFYAWLDQTVHGAVRSEEPNLYAALHRSGVPERQIRSLAYFLGIAGQETTAMLIQSTLHAALRDGHWAACADPDTGPAAAQAVVREVLAVASSVPTWRRIAAVDARVGEHEFAAGEELVLRLSGGILGASGDDSLAFGHGIHRCLGAGLARMEAELVLAETARCLPDLEAAGAAPRFAHLLSFQAPVAVPTRFPFERTDR
ncbi:cytochrome [Glutamicibacter sp. BW80]|uniref:cytochrome P450 n=1 Tax=unclassified Glutamicibacter TaxID=2627139 RepID=UPI000BB92C9D|nr:cytochrome P450 [Glutamicibacter sp. BW80]PCC27927.1 cytochrome [Glutamicibacter sp. BW80]